MVFIELFYFIQVVELSYFIQAVEFFLVVEKLFVIVSLLF